MKKRAPDFDNSKSPEPQSDAPFRKPKLTLISPASALHAEKSEIPVIPLVESEPNLAAISGFDFSTPPWLVSEIQGVLDVDEVIPLEALRKLSSHWLMARRHPRGLSARDVIAPARITHRDTQSYMGILPDDNNHNPLARLHLNRTQKHLGLFNEDRNEERFPIGDLNEIYQHASKLQRVSAFYEKDGKTTGGADDAGL